jgi:hypothetical protein
MLKCFWFANENSVATTRDAKDGLILWFILKNENKNGLVGSILVYAMVYDENKKIIRVYVGE